MRSGDGSLKPLKEFTLHKTQKLTFDNENENVLQLKWGAKVLVAKYKIFE